MNDRIWIYINTNFLSRIICNLSKLISLLIKILPFKDKCFFAINNNDVLPIPAEVPIIILFSLNVKLKSLKITLLVNLKWQFLITIWLINFKKDFSLFWYCNLILIKLLNLWNDLIKTGKK